MKQLEQTCQFPMDMYKPDMTDNTSVPKCGTVGNVTVTPEIRDENDESLELPQLSAWRYLPEHMQEEKSKFQQDGLTEWEERGQGSGRGMRYNLDDIIPERFELCKDRAPQNLYKDPLKLVAIYYWAKLWEVR